MGGPAVIWAVLVLVGTVVLIVIGLTRPSPPAAWTLAVASAIWLPSNHGHLEGPVLFGVDRHHGLTAMDLLSALGLAVAARALHGVPARDPAAPVRPARPPAPDEVKVAALPAWRRSQWRAGEVVGLIGIALAGPIFAYVIQPH